MQARIYTTRTCPYCIKAKGILDSYKIAYNETVLDFDTPEMDELIKKTGLETVPQIFFGDDFIGGCDDLQALVASGGIEKYLALL
ncbi:MAG: glutaredoxin 3 [Eubacteriaceae bacterium]|nr:glutaredoxin 3 [Eubacteriaceae bacterium]